MRSQCSNDESPHRICRVLPTSRRSDVVCFVNDKQVVRPGISGFVPARQCFFEGTQRTFAFQEIDRRDQARKVGPGLDMNSAFASKLADAFAIDNSKFQPKLIAHFLLPLYLESRRTNNQNRSNPVTKDEFLNNEPSFDRLAEANVIRNQQVHAGHRKRTNYWVKLVLVDLDAATEGRMKLSIVGLGDGSPAHGV